jgi:hypothetical protein
MYDCQSDSCTDFSFALIDTVGCNKPLSGTLTATPALAIDFPSLTELATYASRLGYLGVIRGHTLTLQGVSLSDALAINARFAKQLIVSCDLRRDPPVLFG